MIILLNMIRSLYLLLKASKTEFLNIYNFNIIYNGFVFIDLYINIIFRINIIFVMFLINYFLY